MTPMDYVLRTFSLCKKYKHQMAVNHANMTICRGDIYGFVGENGSGKTTIIRLITGLISPYKGSFQLFGVENTAKGIGNARRKMGAIVESPSIYKNMSAYENLAMQCILLGLNPEEKIPRILEEVGLSDLLQDKKNAGNFSLGMRQRLGIAMALIGDPEFLILDEPMNGLDPAGIVELRELIIKLNRERNITFLISSHILTELSLVATKYGIISKGHIIKEITSEELEHELTGFTDIKTNQPEELHALLTGLLPSEALLSTEGGIRIMGNIDLNQVLGAITQKGIPLISINCREPNIEEYYLELIAKP